MIMETLVPLEKTVYNIVRQRDQMAYNVYLEGLHNPLDSLAESEFGMQQSMWNSMMGRPPLPTQLELIALDNPMLFSHVLKIEEKKLAILKEFEGDELNLGKARGTNLDFVTDQVSGKRYSKQRIQ
jgi:hypothetical protein